MVKAMDKEDNKGFMDRGVMDDLLTEARAQYDWMN